MKITIAETPAEMRWVLQGRLVEPWVSELRANWKNAHRSRKACTCVVDLSDEAARGRERERVLGAMARGGA
jgi:hypothetical protein